MDLEAACFIEIELVNPRNDTMPIMEFTFQWLEEVSKIGPTEQRTQRCSSKSFLLTAYHPLPA